ncbi:hypothetical protein MTO96_036278 [Rhipicephalus appendiculatus]
MPNVTCSCPIDGVWILRWFRSRSRVSGAGWSLPYALSFVATEYWNMRVYYQLECRDGLQCPEGGTRKQVATDAATTPSPDDSRSSGDNPVSTPASVHLSRQGEWTRLLALHYFPPSDAIALLP